MRRKRPLAGFPRLATSSSASNLLHTASDSISVSPVSGLEAVKAVSLSPVFGLSLLFPTLIPWTVQMCLAAGPITGQPWVVWRLRCLPGSARSGLLSLGFPCLDNPVFTPCGRDGVFRCPFRPCDPSVRRACRLDGLKETSPDFPPPAGTAFQLPFAVVWSMTMRARIQAMQLSPCTPYADAVVTRQLCLTAAFLLPCYTPPPLSRFASPFWLLPGRDKGGAYRTFP
jgi:hypothetical protein